VIAIIGILAGILLPTLGTATLKAQRAKVKATITQLEQSLANYKTDNGNYPPDHEANTGGAITTQGTYKYRNDSLIKYLDGDTGNGGGAILYYEFREQYINADVSTFVYLDEFQEAYWYHNFHDDSGSTSKITDPNRPLHPWYNRINFQGVQIYSRAHTAWETYDPTPTADVDTAYGGNFSNATRDDFLWISNYWK